MGWFADRSWILQTDPKKKLPRLPIFHEMPLEQIATGDVMIYYGNDPGKLSFEGLTMKHARVKGWKYYEAPFHVSLALGNKLHLNQAKKAVIENINTKFTSTRRIDVIRYLPLLDLNRRDELLRWAERQKGRFYDIPGALWFLIKLWKPWEFAHFCSEQVILANEFVGRRITNHAAKWSAPYHIVRYAMDVLNKGISGLKATVHTLHIGKNYNG